MKYSRTAYLILAHNQPRHLAKLLFALDAPETAFFIHIDAKADETIFRTLAGARPNTVFLAPRYVVNWGGFSLVQATLALLYKAFQATPPFDRFCLLSGADFPIAHKSRILAAFDSDAEFLRVDRKLGPLEDNPQSQNVGYYWFMDSMDPVERDQSGRIPRPAPDSIPLFHGSQWWALTRPCAEYILRYVSDNPEYLAFFHHARCSDEIVFHSIIKHSPFAARISHDFETVTDLPSYFLYNEHACHYIDWNSAGGETLPKVLDVGDLEAILRSKALFARKFREEQSGDLITLLQRTLTD
jgi:hypothetical protein